MVQTWPLHGPSNWFFLSHNQHPKWCFMQNVGFLASILTDEFNFWTWLSNSLREQLTQWVTEGDVDLCTWPEAWGRAYNSQYNKMYYLLYWCCTIGLLEHPSIISYHMKYIKWIHTAECILCTLFEEISKSWPFYDSNMALTGSF